MVSQNQSEAHGRFAMETSERSTSQERTTHNGLQVLVVSRNLQSSTLSLRQSRQSAYDPGVKSFPRMRFVASVPSRSGITEVLAEGCSLMSEIGRSPFYWPVVLLLVFSGLTSLSAVAQHKFGSTTETAHPDAFEPAQIAGSAASVSRQAAAANISGTVFDSSHECSRARE